MVYTCICIKIICSLPHLEIGWHQCCKLSEEATNYNFVVFELTLGLGLEPTIYQTQEAKTFTPPVWCVFPLVLCTEVNF